MMKDVVLNSAHFSKPKIFENLQENTGGSPFSKNA